MAGKQNQRKKSKEQVRKGVKVILPFKMPKILNKM